MLKDSWELASAAGAGVAAAEAGAAAAGAAASSAQTAPQEAAAASAARERSDFFMDVASIAVDDADGVAGTMPTHFGTRCTRDVHPAWCTPSASQPVPGATWGACRSHRLAGLSAPASTHPSCPSFLRMHSAQKMQIRICFCACARGGCSAAWSFPAAYGTPLVPLYRPVARYGASRGIGAPIQCEMYPVFAPGRPWLPRTGPLEPPWRMPRARPDAAPEAPRVAEAIAG